MNKKLIVFYNDKIVYDSVEMTTSRIGQDFGYLLFSDNFSDFDIIVNGEVIRAHKSVLTSKYKFEDFSLKI